MKLKVKTRNVVFLLPFSVFIYLLNIKGLNFNPQLLPFLDTQSSFYSGPVEGVYLRCDADAQTDGAFVKQPGKKVLVDRAKIVRPDFLQQIDEQWTRKQFVKNICTFH